MELGCLRCSDVRYYYSLSNMALKICWTGLTGKWALKEFVEVDPFASLNANNWWTHIVNKNLSKSNQKDCFYLLASSFEMMLKLANPPASSAIVQTIDLFQKWRVLNRLSAHRVTCYIQSSPSVWLRAQQVRLLPLLSSPSPF